MLRYRKFASKVMTGNMYVQIQTLPPTSDAANLHSLRCYYQTRVWLGRGEKLDPTKWGWFESDDQKFLPLKSTPPPAPERLLKVIRCKCKLNRDTKKC